MQHTTLIPTHYFPPAPARPPPPPGQWPIPTFRLRVEDLTHPGAQLFFQHINPVRAMQDAVLAVYNWLYTHETVPRHVETVVLVLRSMPGVAHTSGADIYKEIHFSLDHIRNCESRAKDEINGVLVHEMVHCFQYNGKGTCPSGLVEGIADWVRLHAGLGPPHWKEGKGDKWDAGYEATAYLLQWIEAKYGYGIVRNLNLTLRDRQYEDAVFKEQTGKKITSLWKGYRLYVSETQKDSKV